jgi:putative hemolysin
MNPHPAPRRIPTGARATLAVTGLLVLMGCASAPSPPTQQLQAAELAIGNAEKARVADYASPELSEARDNLAAARNAVEQENMGLAFRLAEASQANAELATAKAEAVKARAVNDEMQKSIDTLKQEMQRNPGAR